MDPAVSWGTLGTHVVAETNRARGARSLGRSVGEFASEAGGLPRRRDENL